MKIINIKKIVFYSLTAIFMYSCEQSEIIETDALNNITSEIEKIETIYQKGDIKIENDNSKEKIETFASSALMKKIKGNLEQSYSKTTTATKATGTYIGGLGVFMGESGNCGTDRTLVIYMDCEDSRPDTRKSGYTGVSDVVGKQNVLLKFCIVYNNFSGNTYNNDFGVLYLGEGYNTLEGSVVTRHFDNEDSSNTNYVNLDGSNLNSTHLGYNSHTILGERNTRLTFHLYYKSRYSVGDSFPNLGYSYGLLGSFGSGDSETGYIHFDDEDSSNANYCYFTEYDPVSNTYIAGKYINSLIPNFMEVGRNTKLYISKAR